MKVIDLLIKRANNEEVPKRIKVFGDEFEFLYQSGDKTYFNNDGDYLFSDEYNWENNLNYEIEIIEEKPKKIEELEILPNNVRYSNKVLYGKVNELTKAVNYLLEKERD